MEGVSWLDRLFEYTFPSFCISCNTEGKILCNVCLDTLELPGVFCCPVCHLATQDGVCCRTCCTVCPIARHMAIMPLTETALIHQLIHLYKYQYLESLEPSFTSLVTRFFGAHDIPHFDYVIPVPLHRKRYVERGFNQSERLARMVSEATGISFCDPLLRVRYTEKQAMLDKASREQNVRDAFTVNQKLLPLVHGKKFLIVDDVFTTGSTVFECARALMKAGGTEVSGFSVARG